MSGGKRKRSDGPDGARDVPTLDASGSAMVSVGDSVALHSSRAPSMVRLIPDSERSPAVRENCRLIGMLPAEYKKMLMEHNTVEIVGVLKEEYEKWPWESEATQDVEIVKEAVKFWIQTHHGLDEEGHEETIKRIVYLMHKGNKKKLLLKDLKENVHNADKVTETLFKIAKYLSQQTRAKTEGDKQSCVQVSACRCAKNNRNSVPGQCKREGDGIRGHNCPCKKKCGPFCYSVSTGWKLQANLVEKVTALLGFNPWTQQPRQGGMGTSMMPPTELTFVPAPPPLDEDPDPTGDLELLPFCKEAARLFLLGGSSANRDSNPDRTLR